MDKFLMRLVGRYENHCDWMHESLENGRVSFGILKLAAEFPQKMRLDDMSQYQVVRWLCVYYRRSIARAIHTYVRRLEASPSGFRSPHCKLAAQQGGRYAKPM